ncbi:hypothetical protein, partial [Fibrobacter sp. UWH1]|uniref:hypothetical protein n=1 Tax=Fibrobacter sp. UWH1 TaxID=1964354 RepID=UPI000B6878D7
MKSNISFILIALMSVVFVWAAPNDDVPLYNIVQDPSRHDFWVGEKIVIPFDCKRLIEILSTDFVAKSTDGKSADIPLSLEKNQKLTEEEEKAYCGSNRDCIVHHWRNEQSDWIEFVANAVNPGTYKFSLKFKYLSYDSNTGSFGYFDTTWDFEFTVHPISDNVFKDVPSHDNAATIVSKDAAAYYYKQKGLFINMCGWLRHPFLLTFA